jgi:hypothetical protein
MEKWTIMNGQEIFGPAGIIARTVQIRVPAARRAAEKARSERNAKLISAAPDMFEALDALMNGTGMNGENFDKARAAIAKARE